MAKRLVTAVLAFVLAVGLMPLPASADDAGEKAAALQLEPGTYVEHEAIAYVLDVSEDSIEARSLDNPPDDGVLAGAQTLMQVDEGAASRALGDDAATAAAEPAAAFARGASADAEDAEGRLVLVRDESKSTEELIAELEADDRVALAEPNYLLGQPEGEESVQAASAANAALDASELADMTDFQWYADNDGSLAGQQAQDAVDIDYGAWKEAAASEAWTEVGARERESLETVVVGVIDTGVDASNPDLANVMWDDGLAIPELAALGGDEHGLSAARGVSSTAPIEAEGGHGTHVAGIVAAEWNDFGTSGVAPNAEIMALRFESSAAEVLACFDYVVAAVEAGVNVRAVNCSWTVGSTASKALVMGVDQMGAAGVVSVFASGNDGSDMDKSLGMPSLLRDDPYVVTVDATDPAGDMTGFSTYGVASTDVMAPGTSILSTYPTAQAAPSYFGEADADAVLYESFDAESRADAALATSGAETPTLTFTTADGEPVGTLDATKRFDGTASLVVPYDAEAAQADASLPGEVADHQVIQSEPIDLSAASERAKYLSIRFASNDVAGDESAHRMADVQVAVRVTDSDEPWLLMSSNSFRAVDASWGGWYVELPENTDYEQFQITLYYANDTFSMTGGVQTVTPADGTVLFDSIGIGDGLSPYASMQGTSMAAPVVTGAVAVLAGQYPDDSAAQLAARLKGAAQRDDRYAELCSTSGHVSVDGGQDPAPVPTSAEVSADGGSIVVSGYFVDLGTQVLVEGVACSETAREELPGSDGVTQITVQVPEGFVGGRAVGRACRS